MDHQEMRDAYEVYAKTYDADMAESAYNKSVKKLVCDFDWSGSVLDLGCGTGLVGRLLHEKSSGKHANIGVERLRDVAANPSILKYSYPVMGVDMSPHMIANPSILNYYHSATIPTVQDALAQPVLADHVACFGTLAYLDENDFPKFLEGALKVAQKSVSFDLEDVSEKYKEEAAKNSKILPCWNHTGVWKDYKMPPGWKTVWNEYGFQYNDAYETKCDIYGYMVQLEKENV